MDGCCLTCGQFDDLEAHHVAGRHNHALIVAVCVDCHRILSRWQLAAGMELEAGAARSDLDRTRALVVGAVHLLQLFGQRHRERSWVSAELSIHTARAVSRLLDSCGPADRPGRWLPDPTVPPAEATPVGWSAAAELDRTTEFAHLTLALARILGDVPPLTIEVLTDLATDTPGTSLRSRSSPRTRTPPLTSSAWSAATSTPVPSWYGRCWRSGTSAGWTRRSSTRRACGSTPPGGSSSRPSPPRGPMSHRCRHDRQPPR